MSALIDQLALLPPHIKLQILAQTQQQQQQSQSKSLADPIHELIDSHTLDPMPPRPFRYQSSNSTPSTTSSSTPPTSSNSNTTAAPTSTATRFFTPAMLHAIESYGFIVLDGFTTCKQQAASSNTSNNADLQRALNEARSMYTNHEMIHAGMKAATTTTPELSSPTASNSANTNGSAWKSSALRGDHHKWLHPNHAEERATYPELHRLVDQMDSLRLELNEVLFDPSVADQTSSTASVTPFSTTGWFPSRSIEVQVASYQGGGSRYVAHRDSVVGQLPHRRITCIVYLSEWQRPEQGGCLRLYTIPPTDETANYELPYFQAANTSTTAPPPTDSIFLPPGTTDHARPPYIDIAPLPNRSVIFASHLMLHEVLPAHRLERFAMTVWMQ